MAGRSTRRRDRHTLPPMRAADHPGRAVVRRDRAGVGADRLHRLRRPARSHGAVARAVRGAAAMARRRPVRAGDRRDQPAARARLHAAGDLLRVAAARHARERCSAGCASSLPGLVADPRTVGAVPVGLAAALAAGRGHGAGAAVAAVAVRAGLGVAAPIWAPRSRRGAPRVLAYALAGGARRGPRRPWLVLVLLGCGALELAARGARDAAGAGRPAIAWLAGWLADARMPPHPRAARRPPGRCWHRRSDPARRWGARVDGAEGRRAGLRRRLRDRAR